MRSATVLLSLIAAITIPGTLAVGQTAEDGTGEGFEMAATSVLVEPVRFEQLVERRLVTGELRATRRADVATQEEGLIVELTADEGDHFKSGDVLARLDSRRLDISLQEVKADRAAAEALLEEREAQLERTRRDLERLRESFSRGGAMPKEVTDGEAEWKVATARVTQAKRQLETIDARTALIERKIEDTRIKAPFDGVIVTRHADLGEWLAVGDPVVEMVSTGGIEAWFNVPQRNYDNVLRHDQPVDIYLEAVDRTISVQEITVIPLVDRQARTFPAFAVLKNEDDVLTAGMSIKVWIPTSQLSERLTVPKNGLLRNETGSYVYVARAEGPDTPHLATTVPVRTLFPVGERFAVESTGLREGDLVVVEGNERLFPMAPVSPQPVAEFERSAARGGDS